MYCTLGKCVQRGIRGINLKNVTFLMTLENLDKLYCIIFLEQQNTSGLNAKATAALQKLGQRKHWAKVTSQNHRQQQIHSWLSTVVAMLIIASDSNTSEGTYHRTYFRLRKASGFSYFSWAPSVSDSHRTRVFRCSRASAFIIIDSDLIKDITLPALSIPGTTE